MAGRGVPLVRARTAAGACPWSERGRRDSAASDGVQETR